MARARSDGLFFLVLGIVALILLGLSFRTSAVDSMIDFKQVYCGARLLHENQDPYDPALMRRIYSTQFGESKIDEQHDPITYLVYFPAGLLILAPVAMLPWDTAAVLWNALILGSLVIAAYLTWRIGADDAPVLTGGLVGFALINGAVVFANGNAAGIVVGLCVIAAWCLDQERLIWLGILCLVVSLTLKPQDAGLIWLFFLLRPGAFRKRALQAGAITALLGLISVLWMGHIAPHWLAELHSNFAAWSGPGGNCDPGPTGLTAKTGTMEVITDLQTVVSVFRDSPSIYSSVTFLFCGPLLILWAIATLRSNSSRQLMWRALAAIAPLTLLVSYHRAYDARLLFLAVPACAMLWAKGEFEGKAAVAVTSFAFFFTGEIPLAFWNPLVAKMHPASGFMGEIETVLLMRLAPLSLLAMCLFFVWVYGRERRIWQEPILCSAGKGEPAPAGRV